MKKAWVLFLSMLLLDHAAILNAAVPRSHRDAIDFAGDIGLVSSTKSGQFCLSIKNGNLKPGQELTLLWIPIADRRQMPEIQSTTVLKLLTNPCDPINSVEGDAAYLVNAGKLDTDKIYTAVVGKRTNFRIIPGEGEVKIDSPAEVTIRSCSSMEGLHFTGWTGGALKGKKVWHRYFYLGYDVEPTCQDPAFKD
jgi:hypothetical protein